MPHVTPFNTNDAVDTSVRYKPTETLSRMNRAHSRNASEPFPSCPASTDPRAKSSPNSPARERPDRLATHFRRRRQQSPLPSSTIEFNEQDGERIQQVFFPPFEEAGNESILVVNRQDRGERASHRASADLQTTPWSRVLFTDDGSGGQQLIRQQSFSSGLLLEPSATSYIDHTRFGSSDSTNLATPYPRRWAYGPNQHVPHGTCPTPAPIVLRESGLLLNSASSFTLNPVKIEDVDVTMESMEMRPRTLQRSVTSQDNVENVKPKLERSNTIAGTRPTKRKAISADMGSRGRFQGFTSNVIESSSTVPQLGVVTRNLKPRPPPLRELPPPSWSSPGHSPPLTSLAPPFSRDMFLFPIKNSVNLSPVSPLYNHSFSSVMSPPITPNTRKNQDLSTYTPLVPSALSTSHLVPTNYLDTIESHLLTVNRCRRRSSMSSFESTTETIRPWDVRGDLTPKPSRAQLMAQAMDENYNDGRSSMMQCTQSDSGWTIQREAEREDRSRKMDKKSRFNNKPNDGALVVEKNKYASRRGEARKTSSSIRF